MKVQVVLLLLLVCGGESLKRGGETCNFLQAKLFGCTPGSTVGFPTTSAAATYPVSQLDFFQPHFDRRLLVCSKTYGTLCEDVLYMFKYLTPNPERKIHTLNINVMGGVLYPSRHHLDKMLDVLYAHGASTHSASSYFATTPPPPPPTTTTLPTTTTTTATTTAAVLLFPSSIEELGPSNYLDSSISSSSSSSSSSSTPDPASGGLGELKIAAIVGGVAAVITILLLLFIILLIRSIIGQHHKMRLKDYELAKGSRETPTYKQPYGYPSYV